MANVLCQFKNCTNNKISDPNKHFFRFRSHDFKTWIKACGNYKLLKLSKSTLTSTRFVCSDHFGDQSYTRVLSPFKNKLKRDAVPQFKGK